MEFNEWLNTQIAKDIWEKKYRYNNEALNDFFKRISGDNIEIMNLMIQKKFLPAGRILANRGLHKEGKKVSYSNCYVITPPEDTIESIFECGTKLARTFSYGGGCGLDISKLSPRGTKLNNAAKFTTGAVSFMDLYSLITDIISQNGRRGALMLSLDCNHPDLEEFINIKSDLNKVTKANISIKITNDFMEAVKNNDNFELNFTRLETGEVISKIVNAKEIFKKIATMNWQMAEPGFLFWDNIKTWNLLSEDQEFEYMGVNPCAEEPLPGGGSCLLGSINLSEFILNPFTDKAFFDYVEFKHVVKEAVIYLNEILDEGLALHPLQEQRDSVRDWRQIGLGIMGLADALIKLGIKYGSSQALDICDSIGFNMINSAIEQSALLASRYGVYPKYKEDAVTSSLFFECNTSEYVNQLVNEHGLRNSQLLTCAPTGSLSTMLGISGGIEPIFNISYTRKTESLHGKEEYYKIYTPIVKEYMDLNDIENEEDLPEYFVTAMTLNYRERINIQSIWQKYIDASISSTVNVPENFTVEDIENLYIFAWENKLKGITIYRDNCDRIGILTNKKEELETNLDGLLIELPRGYIEEVPQDLKYRKYMLKTGCGKLYFFVGVDEYDSRIYDCFTNTDGVGGCSVNTQANSRLLSTALRGGIPVEYLIKQLDKAGVCPSYQYVKGKQNGVSKVKKLVGEYIPDDINKQIELLISDVLSPGKSCASAMAYVLTNILKELDGEDYDYIPYETIDEGTIQIECKHENMRKVEGCITCPDCGYSKCN
jgi:ribonucleoside-diphosphate reductase alpha chain